MKLKTYLSEYIEPNGCIIINSYSVIGDNCTIRHEVTIGNRNSDRDCPIIGNNCNIGAGAKILGAIKIGNNVDIGANAVVITDVPDNCIAVGVPARIIKKYVNKKENPSLLTRKFRYLTSLSYFSTNVSHCFMASSD